MLGRLGTSRRLMGRGLPPLRRSRPLGLLLRLLHHYGRPDPARRQRREASRLPPSCTSGDVHHGYLAEATLAGSAKSRLYQAVCSPLRNALPSKKSYLQSHAWSKPATLGARLLARLAGVPREPLAWCLIHEATFFDNQIATLKFEDRHATITFEKAVLDAAKKPALKKLYECRLA
jgi:hypothetical protein